MQKSLVVLTKTILFSVALAIALVISLGMLIYAGIKEWRDAQ